MALTNSQIERYSRNIALKEVGKIGQEKLLEARVLVIGAGGLGSSGAMYLAAAGVGTIGIVDADRVELSNLQRQILHTTRDIGKQKAVSAKEAMEALNPDVKIHAYDMLADASNLRGLVREYDFIIDATDNFAAKFSINDACVYENKPFCHAGILRFGGQLMTYVPGMGPCYRCIFEKEPPKDAVLNCKQAGIFGAVCGAIGSLQAMEAVKYILGEGELLIGRLLTVDVLSMGFRKVKLSKNKRCAACAQRAAYDSPCESADFNI